MRVSLMWQILAMTELWDCISTEIFRKWSEEGTDLYTKLSIRPFLSNLPGTSQNISGIPQLLKNSAHKEAGNCHYSKESRSRQYKLNQKEGLSASNVNVNQESSMSFLIIEKSKKLKINSINMKKLYEMWWREKYKETLIERKPFRTTSKIFIVKL